MTAVSVPPREAASLQADKELLRAARKAFGSSRGWKLAISMAWMHDTYGLYGLDALAGQLQSLRNRRGPRWPHAVRIGKAAA